MLYQIENIYYDYAKGVLHKNGNEIELTKLQRKVLNFYINNPGVILEKNDIMKKVWGRVVSNNSIDQINSILRNYIENDPTKPKAIVSHFGKGICFEANVLQIRSNKILQNSKLKRGLFALLVIVTIALYVFIIRPKTPQSTIDKTTLKSTNRIIFIPNNSVGNKDFSENTAAQMLISELLKLTNNNDVVDTSRNKSVQESEKLAEHLWQLNPDLNIVKTTLEHQGDNFIFVVQILNGNQPTIIKQFTAPHIHDVILEAVSWISKENSHQTLETSLLELMPKNEYLLETYMRGFSSINEGESAKAIDYFKLSLVEKPDFHLARVSLAKALRRDSQYDEALAQLETLRSLELNESLSILVDSEFAAIQLIRSHLPEAKALFEKIINTYPMSFRLYPAYINLAATEYRMGNYTEAIKQLKILENTLNEKTHPEDAAIVFFTMSGVYMYQNELEISHKYILKSLKLFKQIGDRQREGMLLARLSNYHALKGDLKKAENYIRDSYEIARQLGNKRSQMAALNHRVQFKISQGKFDKASELNLELSNVAVEIGSLSGKTRAAQWSAEIALEQQKYDKAKGYIDQHWKMAQESNSKPSILANLLLQLRQALGKQELMNAKLVIDKIIERVSFDLIQPDIIPLYVDYLFITNQKQKGIEIINQQKKLALESLDKDYRQELDLLLADKYLDDSPQEALNILKKLQVNDLISYPYYSLYAKALFKTGNYIDAMLQIEKAKQKYNQRWSPELHELYNSIKLHLNH